MMDAPARAAVLEKIDAEMAEYAREITEASPLDLADTLLWLYGQAETALLAENSKDWTRGKAELDRELALYRARITKLQAEEAQHVHST